MAPIVSVVIGTNIIIINTNVFNTMTLIYIKAAGKLLH